MSHLEIAFLSANLVAMSLIYDIMVASPNEEKLMDDVANTIGILSIVIFVINGINWMVE